MDIIIHVDNFPIWKAHTQNIHNTIAEKLGLLTSLKQYLSYKATTTLYNSYILPHMDYSSTLWCNALTSDRIYKLQRRAARIITDSAYRAPSDPLGTIKLAATTGARQLQTVAVGA